MDLASSGFERSFDQYFRPFLRSHVIFERFGPPGGLLGVFLHLLGGSWALLGGSWALLGGSWAALGRSWAALGRSWAGLGRRSRFFN